MRSKKTLLWAWVAFEVFDWVVLPLILALLALSPAPAVAAEWFDLEPAAVVRGLDNALGFRDPASVQVRGARVRADKQVICGAFNARNGYGGYGGWRRFVIATAYENRGVIVEPEERVLREHFHETFWAPLCGGAR